MKKDIFKWLYVLTTLIMIVIFPNDSFASTQYVYGQPPGSVIQTHAYVIPTQHGIGTLGFGGSFNTEWLGFTNSGTSYTTPQTLGYPPSTTKSVPDSGLTPGTTYSNQLYLGTEYYIYNGNTYQNNLNTWATFTTLPVAAYSLSASSLTDTQFNLSWVVGNGSATSQTVFYSTNTSGPWSTAASGLNNGTNSVAVAGLTANTTYYVFVRETTTAGDSIDSSLLAVTTLKPPIQQAVDAANAANTSAQGAQTAANTASTNATNAYNNTNTIINSYLSTNAGVIQDNSGNTVLSVAKAASQNALNAKASSDTANNYLTNSTYGLSAINSNVNTASLNALNAKSSADTSASNALNAYNQATNALNAINTTNTNLSTQLNNVQSSVTNIQNYIAPTLTKVSGYNGATATSSTSFNVSLDYSGANEYQVKVDNGSWSGWTSLSSHDTNGYLSVSGISNTGVHTIFVQIRYNSGSAASPEAKGKVSFFKL